MSVFRKRSKSDSQMEFTCTIKFLDDSEDIQITYKKDTLGQWLFDIVCEKLNLLEKDYFGLRYVDAESQRHWMDPLKTVYKQLKGLPKLTVYFRVKFYPEDPTKLHEEITRYYMFLQLRRDLHHGRLLCPHEEAIQLAAYIIQSEVGDYDPQDHQTGYISEFKMLPKQTVKHEERIMDAHKALSGEVPSDSETNFLKKASSLDTYGVDPHEVKDQKGDALYLGVTYQGITTFRGNRRIQFFKWGQIRRLAYEGKTFYVHHSHAEDNKTSKKEFNLTVVRESDMDNDTMSNKPLVVLFKCKTTQAVKYLWRSAVEQQLFFTLPTTSNAQKIRSSNNFFSRGSKFRFSGRCQNEALEASEKILRSEPSFNRTSSLPNFGKKNNADSKNNTMRDSVISDSFREDRRQYNEAAVDVPNILVNNTPLNSSAPVTEKLVEGAKVTAPLAYEEETLIVEEVMEQAVTVAGVNAAPPRESKENGQAVRERVGILETSIDETLPYEPNRTRDESDDDEGDDEGAKPGLDEQIALLDEEIANPTLASELNLSPPPAAVSTKPQDAKSEKGGSGVVKAITLSLLISLVLAFLLFYIVFFSSVKHPLVPKLRQNLKFLEPIAKMVGQQANVMASYFKKK